MEGRQERVEPLDRTHDLSSLGGEVEAVARGDRSMQQCPLPVACRLQLVGLEEGVATSKVVPSHSLLRCGLAID